MSTTYYRASASHVLSHFWSVLTPLVRDTSEESRRERSDRLDIQVRSGDYFATLATELDQISREVGDRPVAATLERIVGDLLYLEAAYGIEKR